MKSVILMMLIGLSWQQEIQINTNRWHQVISERFLSVSMDPLSILLAGDFSKSSINMAKGLSPMFARVGGPSTEKVNFGPGATNITVSMEQWMSVNKFAGEAGVDLIVCLKAMQRLQNVWDSGTALQVISASHNNGYPMIWQFGYEMSDMESIGGDEIGRDLVRLRKILDAFPYYEGAPILPPGLSTNNPHFLKAMLQQASDVLSALPLHMNFTGIPAERISEEMGESLAEFEEQIANKDILLRPVLPSRPIWIAEREPSKGDFRDATLWMVKLGSAAKFGVQVIMRQPHMFSFHSPTPDYWASLLFKNLVGRFVLDTRITIGLKNSLFVYSHCTIPTNQNNTVLDSMWNYEKGAMTIYGVNTSPRNIQVSLKGFSIKEEIAHFYVLTSDQGAHSIETLFNGQKLSLSPKGELPVLSPRVSRTSRFTSVTLPANSIFFIVFPETKLRVCMNNLLSPDDITKKLNTIKNSLPTISQDFPHTEDNNGVYVSFTKRKVTQVKEKEPELQLDLNTKLMRELNKVAGKLGLNKLHLNTQEKEEKVKYNFYSDNSWLNKIADVVENKEFLNEKDSSSKEDEMSKQQKYSLLTSAIFGNNKNETHLLKSLAPLPIEDTNGRSKRSIEDEISTVEMNHSNKTMPIRDGVRKIHSMIVDYVSKNGKELDPGMLARPVGIDSLKNFLNDLTHIKVMIGNLIANSTSDIKESLVAQSTETVSSDEVCLDRKKRDMIGTFKEIKTVNEIGRMKTEDVPPAEDDFKNRIENRDESVSLNSEKIISNISHDNSAVLNKTLQGNTVLPDLSGDKSFQYFSNLNNLLNEMSSNQDLIQTQLQSQMTPQEAVLDQMTYMKPPTEEKQIDKTVITPEGDSLTSLVKENPLKNMYIQEQEDPTLLNSNQNQETNNDQSQHKKTSEDMAVIGHSKQKLTSNISTKQSVSNIESKENLLKQQPDLLQIKKLNEAGITTEITEENISNYNSKESISSGIQENSEKDAYEDMKSQVKQKKEINQLSGGFEENKLGVSKVVGLTKMTDLSNNLFTKFPTFDINDKLEERKQRLEQIKLKLLETREKIKEALSKASLKQIDFSSTKYPNIFENVQLPEINVKRSPDFSERMSSLMGKINGDYLQSMQPKPRFRRQTIISDDINEDVYDYSTNIENIKNHDKPSYGYLVPLRTKPKNILLNNAVYPAKVYSIVDSDELIRMSSKEDDINSRLYNAYDEPHTLRNPSGYRTLRPEERHHSNQYQEPNLSLILLPDNFNIGKQRAKRSLTLPEQIHLERLKQSVPNNAINEIKKEHLHMQPQVDEVKLQVEENLIGQNPNLYTLASEYTKIKETKNEESKESKVTEAPSSEDEYEDDWVDKAERVSPPLNQNRKTHKKDSNKSSDFSLISSVLDKLKILLHMIKGFSQGDIFHHNK